MKQTLALHICCAPDEAYAVSLIKDLYDIHCFFSNSNIFPEDEYVLREKEALKAAEIYGLPFSVDEFVPASWEAVITDFEDSPEGGDRCRQCFLLRLRRTAAFARQKGIPLFGTVMSVSPHKSTVLLDECGGLVSHEYGLQYAPFNFKKNDGFRKSVALSSKLGLYRQNYCGCRLSRDERDKRIESRRLKRQKSTERSV